jgi:hypothetical protein
VTEVVKFQICIINSQTVLDDEFSTLSHTKFKTGDNFIPPLNRLSNCKATLYESLVCKAYTSKKKSKLVKKYAFGLVYEHESILNRAV